MNIDNFNKPLTMVLAHLEKKVMMKSAIAKRSIVVAGHKTSVSLEEPFWLHLKQIAHEQQVNLSNLVGQIDGSRQQGNLSSAIRLFVLDRVKAAALGGSRSPVESTEHSTALPTSLGGSGA